nr:S8 family serine peptidase [Candidatus Woesearchaeota archaeon]
MRVYILLIVLLLLVINVSISQEDKVDFRIEENLNTDEKVSIIVVLKDENKIDRINSEDLIIQGNFSSIDGFYGEATKDGIEKLKDDDNVERIDYDMPVKAFLQDSINIVNAKKTHETLIKNSNITGKGNTVCIIDTGIDDKHPDLKDKVLDGYNFVKDNNNFKDDNGHGTHVAGIVAANGILKGIAKEASLIAIKSLDENGVGSISSIISSIEWCNLNSNKYNITAITLSLGTAELYDEYCDDSFLSLAAAVNNAIMKNISVVAATGNNGDSNFIASPACIKNITAVAATDKSNKIAGYSNRNKLVKLLATGDNINSTYTDKDQYEIISGTSMAAPHVAGAVALLQQYQDLDSNMKETPEEIVNALVKSGSKISENGNIFSLINIYEAVKKSDKKIPDIFNENKTLTALNNSDIDFSVNVTDTFLDSVWIGINYSSNFENITILSNNSMYKYTLKAGKFNSKDNISYRFYANDSNGNINFTQFKSFIVSTINLTLIKPENNSIFSNNVLNFTFIAIDPGDKAFPCSLYIDDVLKSNITTLNNTISSFNNINLTGKKHQWYVICGNSSKYLEKSATNVFTANYVPIVIKISPGDNSEVNSTNLTIKFNASLDSYGDIWYMYKDLNKSVCLNCSSKLFYITFESFGNKTVYLFANNSDSEENKTKITFKLNLDTDGDNIPDNLDNDDDNDGILDNKDKLNGNTSNINRNFNDIEILIDNSSNLSQEFSGLRNIRIIHNGNNLIEFNFNFSNDVLNLGNVTIEKNTGSNGSIIIRGLNLNGNKKTSYIDKLNNGNSICIKDEEI